MRHEDLERAAVAALADAAAGAEPEAKPAKREPRVITSADVEALEVEPPKFIIENLLTTPGAWSIIGSHKCGKTGLGVQIAICYHAGAPFLEYYRTLESRAALVIVQDDPLGVVSLKEILRRSPIPRNPQKFLTVEGANFTIGPNLVRFLEREIPARDIGLVVLDSYTAMRPPHGPGLDIVRVERSELNLLDALAKKLGCVILLIHHRSRGNAALDWSEQAAGTFAIGAATEGEIHISRFRELPSTARERLIRVRGRRIEGLEVVVRFQPETLAYEWLMEGAACELYPVIQQLRGAFGSRAFTPKELYHEIGMGRATAHRLLGRLLVAGIASRAGYGQYAMRAG